MPAHNTTTPGSPASNTNRRFHDDNTVPPEAGWTWVFGSNLAGIHGKGAAKVAKTQFGAQYGCGKGPTGQSYAIPTKDAHLDVLDLASIEISVQSFLGYARLFPERNFYVTRIGCGLAGYRDDQIAPLFAYAPSNCSLPKAWASYVAPAGPCSF